MNTLDEAFNKSVRGLLAQGGPAKDLFTSKCKYRMQSPDGKVLKCAIGQLIPDEEYSTRYEKMPVSEVITLSLRHLSHLKSELSALQLAHDRADGMSSMVSSLRAFAAYYRVKLDDDIRKGLQL